MEALIRRWESERRYYIGRLETDLLGDVVLVCVHGGRYNRLGGVHTAPVESWAAGVAELDRIGRERAAHRYVEVKIRPE